MNPRLAALRPYPFERLRRLFADVQPNQALAAINLSIGEPRHPTPEFIRAALHTHSDGLASYPLTAGRASLREAIAHWLQQRYAGAKLDPATQIIPTLGSREALFAFAQAVLDGSQPGATVVCPNPFYQIYEGAALLAGCTPFFINSRSVGMGSFGSSRANAGKPSRLITTTMRCAGVCAKAAPNTRRIVANLVANFIISRTIQPTTNDPVREMENAYYDQRRAGGLALVTAASKRSASLSRAGVGPFQRS